ncbi:MAG: SDR family oxidoreductase [Lachnospiraceae bacterium]|nr:SDR family oxidoreductase [Lachnospiraceae bacterium]
MDFSGKVVVITGGASDIGKSISTQLGDEKCVIVLMDINRKGLEEFKESQKGRNARIILFAGDMTDEKIVENCFNQVKTEYGKIDYLFNIVGYAMVADARDMTAEHWKDIVNVNFFGVLYPTQAGYKIMAEQRSGSIINMSSIGGVVPSPFNTGYAATKAAIISLSTSLREEAKEFGVNISVVCAGGIDTKLWDDARLLNIPAEGFKKLIPPSTLASPEKAASIMIKGSLKKKRMIFFPASGKIFNFIYKFMPIVYCTGVEKITVRSLRSLRQK